MDSPQNVISIFRSAYFSGQFRPTIVREHNRHTLVISSALFRHSVSVCRACYPGELVSMVTHHSHLHSLLLRHADWKSCWMKKNNINNKQIIVKLSLMLKKNPLERNGGGTIVDEHIYKVHHNPVFSDMIRLFDYTDE